MLLGGIVAERLILNDTSTGASNDIQRATKLARSMVTKYGMSDTLGPIVYGSNSDEVFIGRDIGHVKDYSESTAAKIDEEVKRIVMQCNAKTEKILTEHMDKLHKVAKALVDKEKLSGEEFEKIMSNIEITE